MTKGSTDHFCPRRSGSTGAGLIVVLGLIGPLVAILWITGTIGSPFGWGQKQGSRPLAHHAFDRTDHKVRLGRLVDAIPRDYGNTSTAANRPVDETSISGGLSGSAPAPSPATTSTSGTGQVASAPTSSKAKYLNEVLDYVRLAQRESNHFRDLGRNRSSVFLGVILAFSTFITGLGALFQSHTKLRKWVVTLFVINLTCLVCSSMSLFLHHEGERFAKENLDKYTALSLEMNEVISQFYIELRANEISVETIDRPETLKALIELDRETDIKLRSLARSYHERYRLNTNPSL